MRCCCACAGRPYPRWPPPEKKWSPALCWTISGGEKHALRDIWGTVFNTLTVPRCQGVRSSIRRCRKDYEVRFASQASYTSKSRRDQRLFFVALRRCNKRVPHHVVYIASWLGPGQTVSESVKQKRLAKTCCKGRFMHISNGGAQQVSFCVAVREARESQTASAAVSGSTV